MRKSVKDLKFLVELINKRSKKQYVLDQSYGAYRIEDSEGRNVSPRLLTSQIYLWLSGYLEAIVVENS